MVHMAACPRRERTLALAGLAVVTLAASPARGQWNVEMAVLGDGASAVSTAYNGSVPAIAYGTPLRYGERAGASFDFEVIDERTCAVGPDLAVDRAGNPAVAYTDEMTGDVWIARRDPIAGWTEFRRCPPEPSGLHEIAFQYDESLQPWAKVNDDWEGTKVAGHPVILSLLIDDQGVAQGIRIVTDPDARAYLKKKAFLLGVRVMGRYGRDGWQCVEAKPDEGKAPIGGMFIDRHCEKTFHNRHLILDTELYRTAEQHGRDYTDRARLEIFEVTG